MDDVVKDLTGMSGEEKAKLWEEYVRNGVNSLLDVYLPLAKNGNINVEYKSHIVEKLESGPVYDKTKAGSVLISVVFEFDKPIDLTKPPTNN